MTTDTRHLLTLREFVQGEAKVKHQLLLDEAVVTDVRNLYVDSLYVVLAYYIEDSSLMKLKVIVYSTETFGLIHTIEMGGRRANVEGLIILMHYGLSLHYLNGLFVCENYATDGHINQLEYKLNSFIFMMFIP